MGGRGLTDEIRHVRAAGSPREIGEAHGAQARDLVRANRDLYFRRFKEEWGLARDAILERAGAYEAVVRQHAPDYAEAMHGLSDGSGVPLEEIVALNVRYEIVYSEYSRRGRNEAATLPSGCTALGLLPSRTANGGLLLAQNWDWISGVRPIVLEARARDGPAFLGFTEAGIVGAKVGLNAAGVGLAINGLVSDRDAWDRKGLPFHVRCWRVLHARTLDEAERAVRQEPTSCSANFLLGQALDAGGRLVDIETSPAGSARIEPEDGVLTHANHFHCADALGVGEPLLAERTSTLLRESRMRALLRGASARKVRVEDVASFLRDHEGHPNSICRHPDPALREAERYETVVSIILDLGSGELRISSGNPCLAEYRTFSLHA
ncbi:MAG: C45 family autoproteolytic acyltransferase/hydrolase [Methanobacteriota archaeon]